MALDEAIFESADRPALRVYTWAGPCATFGYGQSLAGAAGRANGLPLVRRWTGGGLVPHDGDWTFSLAVPAGEPAAALRPADAYCALHEAVVRALREAGVTAELSPGDAQADPGACFVAPVRHDVVGGFGDKLCGGAQRRTRRGFLHQGSVRVPGLPGDFPGRFAAALGAAIVSFVPAGGVLDRADELAVARYGTADWHFRVP